ncbi:ion transporter, partial [Alphaproteobacteria bacterium]|nr:ion transporter [Alphaproteobacteria bacterium]
MQLNNLLKNFIESKPINVFITLVILINAITLGLETSEELVTKIGKILIYIDNIALTIFVIELLIKLFVYRLSFFKNGWNVFDFIIVTIALIPTSGPLSILRAFRIFRALRLLSMVPSMKKVIQAMFYAIPGIASVGTIILLIFYISSVLVTNFFGNKFEDWFGSIGESMYSLFQIMTLESWSMGIVRSFDVATFLIYGAAHMAIIGSDVLEEFNHSEIYSPIDLKIGLCRLVVATTKEILSDEDPL